MKRSFLIIFIILLSFYAEAKHNQTCVVKYKTQEGWSKKYTVEVTFLSGLELNNATNSYKYSSYALYAVIFWQQDQASVIKISNLLTCGETVEKDCISNVILDLNGVDQDGDVWNICVSQFCF